jgi:hypothetical protein
LEGLRRINIACPSKPDETPFFKGECILGGIFEKGGGSSDNEFGLEHIKVLKPQFNLNNI